MVPSCLDAEGPQLAEHACRVTYFRDPSRVDPPLRQPQTVRVESRLHALAGNSEDPPPPAVHLCAGMFSRRIVAAVDACLRLQGWRRIQSCRDLLGMLLEQRTDPEYPRSGPRVPPREEADELLASEPRSWHKSGAPLRAVPGVGAMLARNIGVN